MKIFFYSSFQNFKFASFPYFNLVERLQKRENRFCHNFGHRGHTTFTLSTPPLLFHFLPAIARQRHVSGGGQYANHFPKLSASKKKEKAKSKQKKFILPFRQKHSWPQGHFFPSLEIRHKIKKAPSPPPRSFSHKNRRKLPENLLSSLLCVNVNLMIGFLLSIRRTRKSKIYLKLAHF